MNGFGRGSGGIGGGRFTLFPPVIKYLLIINVAVFILQYFILEMVYVGDMPLNAYFFNYFALHTADFSFSFTEGSFWPWQLLTFQFMHGGLWHLFFNMFAIWMFGTELEQRWGSRKFLLFYLLSGIGAGLTQLIISSGPTVGASGGVFGVLLAFGLTFPDRRIFIFPIFIPIKAKFFVMIYAGLELILGVTGTSDGIAHLAHVGGAVTGWFLLKYGDQTGVYKFFENLIGSFGKSGTQNSGFKSDLGGGTSGGSGFGGIGRQQSEAKRYKINWETDTDESNDYSIEDKSSEKTYIVDGEEITQHKIDEILDKISASGYQNLTDREKKILNELSRKI